MQLRLQLHAKFPETPEDDILKVVGNLLYYRYMNPAIVAPDGFDIVDVGMEQQLSPDQVGCLEGRERGREGGRERWEKEVCSFLTMREQQEERRCVHLN